MTNRQSSRLPVYRHFAHFRRPASTSPAFSASAYCLSRAVWGSPGATRVAEVPPPQLPRATRMETRRIPDRSDIRPDHAIVTDVSEDDRALMERLAALEAEVKADADAQRARKQAALEKVREQRAAREAEQAELASRQAE